MRSLIQDVRYSTRRLLRRPAYTAAAVIALALRGRALGRRLLLATLGGAALSLVIELVQTAIPTRVSAFDDWLLNTLGVFFGAAVVCVIVWRNQRDQRLETGD